MKREVGEAVIKKGKGGVIPSYIKRNHIKYNIILHIICVNYNNNII